MSEEQRTTSYDSARFEDNFPPGIARHYWNQARSALIVRTLGELPATPRSVLDIGCGPGVVLETLVASGFEATGVELGVTEPLPAVRERVRYGVAFESLPEEERAKVDVALLLDVLEHLDDPAHILRNVRTELHGLSSLLVTVPARQELWTSYDRHFGHVRRYSLLELRTLLTSSGYRVSHIRYFFHWQYLPLLFLATAFRGKRKHKVSSPSMLPLHRMLAAYSDLEHRILPGGLWGSSLLAVAEPLVPESRV